MTSDPWPDEDTQPTRPLPVVGGATVPERGRTVPGAEATLVLRSVATTVASADASPAAPGGPREWARLVRPWAGAPLAWLRSQWRFDAGRAGLDGEWRRPLMAAAWCLFWALVSLRGGMYSWHYFVTAGTLAAQTGASAGWHLFAAHPELQFGPVTVLVARLLTSAGAAASYPLAAVAMLVMGGLVCAAALVLRPTTGRPVDGADRRRSLFLLAPAWLVLSLHYGHLDDALALSFAGLALLALSRGRRTTALVLFALATGAKPWALPMGLAALVLPPWREWRTRNRRRADWVLYLGLVVLPWLPFLVADPSTLGLGSFHIGVASDSVLTLFTSATATPSWTRPAQFLLAALAAWWCARRGHWAGVPLVVVTIRMALDPGTYGYYTSGLLVAALLLDAVSSVRWRAPAVLGWWLVTLVLDGPAHQPGLAAACRLVMMLVLAATTMAAPADPRPAMPGGAAAFTSGSHAQLSVVSGCGA